MNIFFKKSAIVARNVIARLDAHASNLEITDFFDERGNVWATNGYWGDYAFNLPDPAQLAEMDDSCDAELHKTYSHNGAQTERMQLFLSYGGNLLTCDELESRGLTIASVIDEEAQKVFGKVEYKKIFGDPVYCSNWTKEEHDYITLKVGYWLFKQNGGKG